MTQAKWILAAVLAAPLMGTQAFAEGTPAERAAEMLARAGAVDAKCHYLHGEDQDALSSLVARAELSLANQVSVTETKATMARGRAAGSAAQCTAAEKDNVHSILGAASASANATETKPDANQDQADAAPSERQPIINQNDNQNPVRARKRAPIIRGAWNDQFQSDDRPPSSRGSDRRLTQYAMMTETYFVALRCGAERGPDVGGLYQNIRATHDELMQDHEAGELSFVLRRAKMRAASRGCF